MSHATRRPTLGQVVEDYYAEHSLPGDRLRRLAHKRRPRGPWFWMSMGALGSAAALIVLAVTMGYVGPGFSGSLAPAAVLQPPNLIAVQIHAEWCPRSPEVAPLFTKLLTRYGNEPVLFVSFDITDEVRRAQAEQLAESLGIPTAFDQPFGSGMIKLIDRERDILLAAITGNDDYREFEFQLASFLETGGRDSPDGGT